MRFFVRLNHVASRIVNANHSIMERAFFAQLWQLTGNDIDSKRKTADWESVKQKQPDKSCYEVSYGWRNGEGAGLCFC
jgi:hypothetical protein